MGEYFYNVSVKEVCLIKIQKPELTRGSFYKTKD